MFQWRGDFPRMRDSAKIGVWLRERHGFAYYADWARLLLGWADCLDRRVDEGFSQMHGAIESLDRQRALARRPYFLSLLADACLATGRSAHALEIVESAIDLAARHRELWWTAELHRMKGELLPPEAAHAVFRDALDIARDQGSRALELRAAISLARCRQRLGRATGAENLLDPLIRSLPGADARDLSEAARMLGSAAG